MKDKESHSELILLADWLKNLIERAVNIQSEDDEFHIGVLHGYYECISHILSNIDGLNLWDKLNDSYLEGFKPDSLINGTATNPFKK
ncbi:MAG: hypothetical protein IPL55_14950 [Saprospiraceae bacterium]|jgi:hypothetical protein|nr:hypothetical protein [Saprospiraceae bacterium]MBL0026351.1 hypothetical protein [Saprospiraceae bacterium]